MEIALLCQENTFADFVGDLSDITVLLSSMSPIVHEFMKKSFFESTYTKKIENIYWKKGTQRLVFASNT